VAGKLSSGNLTPLDWFLRKRNSGNDRLKTLALQAVEEPFHPESLRIWLIPRLKYFRYPQPHPSTERKTFFEIVENADVLHVLLLDNTLRRLWRCLLLKKIVADDHKLRRQAVASSGQSLQFHREMARRIQEDLDHIVTIGATYRVKKLTAKLYDIVERQLQIHKTLASESTTTPTHSELLAGRPRGTVRRRPRDEERATQVAIYRVLHARLQTPESRRKGISGIFLCQLSELISRGIGGASFLKPRVEILSDGKTLWRAVKRSKS
jgi:hypothetical protein